MNKLFVKSVILATISLFSFIAAAQNTEQLFKNCAPSCVTILTEKGQGSGFFIDSFVIATNHHVIDSVTSYSAVRFEETEKEELTLIGFDEENDLALLSIKKPGKPLASYEQIERAQFIAVIGTPAGFDQTYSEGKLSFIDKNFFTFSAPISPGSSGSPVFNASGQVVGVVCSQYTKERVQMINRAIKANLLTALYNKHKGSMLFSKGYASTTNADKIYYYTKYLQDNPTDYIALNNRGAAYRAINEFTLARLDLDKAIKLAAYPLAYANRAWVNYADRNFEKAFDDAITGVMKDAKKSFCQYTLAYMKQKKQDFAGAIVHYKAANVDGTYNVDIKALEENLQVVTLVKLAVDKKIDNPASYAIEARMFTVDFTDSDNTTYRGLLVLFNNNAGVMRLKYTLKNGEQKNIEQIASEYTDHSIHFFTPYNVTNEKVEPFYSPDIFSNIRIAENGDMFATNNDGSGELEVKMQRASKYDIDMRKQELQWKF